jgi:hypothetical protein
MSLAAMRDPVDREKAIAELDEAKNQWLETPQQDCGGRIPANLIASERRRLPITLTAKEVIIDDDCELCRMAARDIEMGYGPTFWGLDGSHMDDEFAFSFCRTEEEWMEENRQREEFNREFDSRWKEREERLARGETVDDEFGLA